MTSIAQSCNTIEKSRSDADVRPRDGERAMNAQIQPYTAAAERYIPFESVALVLQGGGALGAYQAGVYEALAEAGIHPDWIASVSIGAINAAIIAGNPPNTRVDSLRASGGKSPRIDFGPAWGMNASPWRGATLRDGCSTI
jgi:predicted acylesterase/phospholipase RssA